MKCVCGHGKSKHIYEEGACRPGFICECQGYTPNHAKQDRDAFQDWFSTLLFQQESCLLRDVLRDSKQELFKHWLERQPLTQAGISSDE